MKNVANVEWLVDTIHKHEEAVAMLYNAAAKFYAVDSMYNAIKEREHEAAKYCQAERNRVADTIRDHGSKIKAQRLLPFGDYGYTEWYTVDGETYQIRCNEDGSVVQIKRQPMSEDE